MTAYMHGNPIRIISKSITKANGTRHAFVLTSLPNAGRTYVNIRSFTFLKLLYQRNVHRK